MKVKATEVGFYECFREVGDTFDIPKELFSETWMERVGPGRKKVEEPEVEGEQ